MNADERRLKLIHQTLHLYPGHSKVQKKANSESGRLLGSSSTEPREWHPEPSQPSTQPTRNRQRGDLPCSCQRQCRDSSRQWSSVAPLQDRLTDRKSVV